MPTRANAIGRYDGLAPELKDTLRRNGMQARLVHSDGGVLLAVQGSIALFFSPCSKPSFLAFLIPPS